MRLSNLLARIRSRWSEIRGAVLQDLGTVSLGAAAIFLTRVFPSSSTDDFSIGMMVASIGFAGVGITLRVVSKL